MLIAVASIVIAAYLGIGIMIYFLQPRIIYYPIAEFAAQPADAGLEFEDVYIPITSAAKINAWYFPSTSAQKTILFCHGNGGNISYYLEKAAMYNHMGLNCLIFDYQGYGKSAGKPSEQGTYDDAAAAYKWLVNVKKIDPSAIIVHGWSLGGPIAANLAASQKVAGLILESTITSAPDMACKIYPIFPARLLCRYKYDTAKYLANITCPVLVIHSPEDEIIPFSMGQKLFNLVKQPKQFLQITGSHNDGA
ncbi:MAG: hypothetical protein A2Y07_05680, partial [Planctomycetes bacterium GWF2_50_10]